MIDINHLLDETDEFVKCIPPIKIVELDIDLLLDCCIYKIKND